MEAGGYDVVVSLQSNNVVIKRKETPGSRGKLRVQTDPKSDSALTMTSCWHMSL